MNQKVIAYLCVSHSWGGLEMNQLRNAQWMKDRGHEVIILGLKNARILNEANKSGISTSIVDQHKKYYDFKRANALKKIIKEKAITHLVLRDPKDISLGVTAKKWLKNKLHLSYFMEMQLGVKKKDFIHTWRFNGLDLWSCPLEFLADQVKSLTNFPGRRIKVIPSGMNLSQFESLPNKSDARDKLELPKGKILLGLIGRLDPFKGHMLLMDAYEELTDEVKSKIELVFLGEKMNPDIDNFYNRLLERMNQPSFQSKVHILPFRKDVELFYTAIDAFIMASKAETFGMVTIESMASGTPVIGSNAGGTPELLEFGDHGILFKTMNKKSLAQAIEYFIKDYKYDAGKLKSNVQKFSHHAVCEKVENALQLN